MSFGLPEEKFEPISKDSYYERLFEKVRYYNPEIYKIFDIARLMLDDKFGRFSSLDFLIKEVPKVKKMRNEIADIIETQTTADSEDVDVIDNMRSLKEIPSILKKQFMLPDEIFDQKLIFRDLLVKRKIQNEIRYSLDSFVEDRNKMSMEKFLRRQRSYILMDISGSTKKKNRLLLEKAIILNYLENNQKEKGEIFFRAFNHDLGPLYRTAQQSDYKYILNMAILPQKSSGQTNIEKALLQAIDDVKEFSIDEKAEILLLTDGLSFVDATKILEKSDSIKIHIILIGKDPLLLSVKELSELFQDKHKFEMEYLKRSNFSDNADKKLQAFESLHKDEKRKIQKDIQDSFQRNFEEIAEKSGGKFIEVDDLDQSEMNHDLMLKNIRSEMAHLQELLKNRNLSPLERDRLLEQYLSLKNYLNNYYDNEKLTKSEKEEIDTIRNEMRDYVKENDDLLEMLKSSKLKFKMTVSDAGKMLDVSMVDLFKIIFYKLRTIVFKHKEL